MQLGRYQILKQLATGDVADVLLARASGLEGFARHIVIKRIRPDLASEKRLVESFLEEARIAASLHHHNVVQVHDIGEQDGAYFFAMEYVHGEDVRRLLTKVRDRNELVPLEHVIAIVSATAAGLHHAHEQKNPAGQPLGLVHRDVCPANILLGYDGSVKIVDFGMAKAALRSEKTAGGVLKDKASYMSPEECCGQDVDRRADTFALGIVLYELATARRLFKGTTEFLTMAAIVEGEILPPSTYRSDLPPTFDAIVMRALDRDPNGRYQSAEDLRAALEQFSLDQQLRASNKALADYFTALFGHRLEPWHEDAAMPASGKQDNAQGTGLVAAPPTGATLTERHAFRRSAPIMIAQTSADEAELTGTADQEQTRNERRRSAPVPVQREPNVPYEDPDDATLIAPPIFVDEESTVSRQEQENIAAVVLAADPVIPEVAPPIAPLPDDEPPPLPSPILADPMPRARSEMYVGPPAPPSVVPRPLVPFVQKYLATPRQRIIAGAVAAVILFVVVFLVAR